MSGGTACRRRAYRGRRKCRNWSRAICRLAGAARGDESDRPIRRRRGDERGRRRSARGTISEALVGAQGSAGAEEVSPNCKSATVPQARSRRTKSSKERRGALTIIKQRDGQNDPAARRSQPPAVATARCRRGQRAAPQVLYIRARGVRAQAPASTRSVRRESPRTARTARRRCAKT